MTVEPGLCGRCANVRVVETRTGSRFYLCELSRTRPEFPRYPRLPVLSCRGFVPDASVTSSNPAPPFA